MEAEYAGQWRPGTAQGLINLLFHLGLLIGNAIPILALNKHRTFGGYLINI